MDRQTWNELWQQIFAEGEATPQKIITAFMQAREPNESQQSEKRQTRYDYTQGPVYYLLQQIVKAMQDAGYPCKIAEFYRTPDRQAQLLAKRPPVTKAGPYGSAHQYMCAGDLIHPAKGWNVSEEYWETLAACVRNVSEKFGVGLDHGHYWSFRDSAHIQLEDWRAFKSLVGENKPNESDLVGLWYAILPRIAKNKAL